MGDTSILYPVFAQVLLTFLVQFRMGFGRVGAINSRKVKISDITLNPNAWPDDVKKSGNNFLNQFQLPVLFYALCAFLLLTRSVDYIHLLLAWAFVGSRYLHAFIHLTYNNIFHRFYAFFFGSIVLMAAWIYFFLHLVQRSL